MSTENTSKTDREPAAEADKDSTTDQQKKKLPKEIGGQKGPEPTRYGDWEKNGIISDF